MGVLIQGTAGLGKSCLAGKICERLPEYSLIIIHGKLNSFSLKQALKDAFIMAQDEQGKEILGWNSDMKEILTALCTSCFRENNYLILMDDFEQNLKKTRKGNSFRLASQAKELLKTILEHLPACRKKTQLIITCRYGFSLMVEDRDLVEKRLERVGLNGFQILEQMKKVRELEHIGKLKKQETVEKLLAAGCGNPRLMEWLDDLVGKMGNTKVLELLQAVKEKRKSSSRSISSVNCLNKVGMT